MASKARALTANERLKRRSTDVVWLSLMAAVGVHFLVFQLWPEIEVPDWGAPVPDSVIVVQFEDIPLPVAPEPFSRPAAPVMSLDAPPDATIETVSFEQAAELPPPPPPDATSGAGERQPFVVYDVAPRLLNGAEVNRALQRAYPTHLRDAGVGGVVVLQIHIDADGLALDARVAGSSGYEALDGTAVELIDVMRFSPAMNRDRKVAVWVEIPIEFKVQGDGAEALPVAAALGGAG